MNYQNSRVILSDYLENEKKFNDFYQSTLPEKHVMIMDLITSELVILSPKEIEKRIPNLDRFYYQHISLLASKLSYNAEVVIQKDRIPPEDLMFLDEVDV